MKYLSITSSQGKARLVDITTVDVKLVEAMHYYLENYEGNMFVNGFDVDDIQGELSECAQLLGLNVNKCSFEIVER